MISKKLHEDSRFFLTHLGDPHLAYPVIHVAGTNGKGSVCAMVTQTLVEAGYRVGTYTSPHLEHVNERLCLNGLPIRDDELSRAIDELDRSSQSPCWPPPRGWCPCAGPTRLPAAAARWRSGSSRCPGRSRRTW